MNNVTLSVIVPVYNVQDYLAECVDSLIFQTYQDFEIILVDDGSTDNSGKICDEYARKYDKIKSFHKANGGLSSARNFGIEKSTGIYLAFIDSDDFVASNMFEVLVGNAIKYDADISMGDYYVFIDKKNYYARTIPEKETTVYVEKNVLSRLYSEFSACNKIYHKPLFNDIKYPEGKLYEDARTTYLLADKAKRVVITPESFYYYRQRSMSIMNTFSVENFIDRVNVYKEIYNFVKDRFSQDELSKFFYKKNSLILELLATILVNKKLKENRVIIFNLVSELQKPIVFNNDYSLKQRILTIFFRIYKILFE